MNHPCLLFVKLLNHDAPRRGHHRPDSETHVRVGEPAVTGEQVFEPEWFERWKSWEGEAIVIGRDFDYNFGPGDVDPRIAELRAVLKADGERPEHFDDALGQAARAFQKKHGLPVTGRLGPRTILALDARSPLARCPAWPSRSPVGRSE